MKLRHAKETDVKSIIELQAQLDRPLPKDRYETKKFQKLVKGYIQSNSTKDNRGIILAMTGSKIIGLGSFVLLERLNQPLRDLVQERNIQATPTPLLVAIVSQPLVHSVRKTFGIRSQIGLDLFINRNSVVQLSF